MCEYMYCVRVWVYTCICSYIHMCVCVCVCVWIIMYICLCLCIHVCMAAAIWTRSCDPDSLTKDSDLFPLWTRYASDLKTDPQTIWRSIPVRTMKTRRHFESKTVSFHVSVSFCIIFIFIVVSIIYLLLVLFHVTIRFILPVWLPISLHEISMSIHFNYIVYLNAYQHYFIWWLIATINSGLVVVYLVLDLIS